ncbi:MAG: ATP-binding protein [Syntrophomonas sp.]
MEKKIATVLVIVALTSTLATAAAGFYVARSLFSEYLNKTAFEQAENWAAIFIDYYEEKGSFEGIEDLSMPMGMGRGNGHMRGASMNNRVMLVNTGNVVLFDSAGLLTGSTIKSDQAANGIPVKVDSKVVGKVISSRAGWQNLNSLEADFINSLIKYSSLTGLLVMLLALWVGLTLARPIARPIQALSRATHKLAQGDMDTRVPLQGEGEVRQLAENFNSMAEALRKTETVRRNLTADVAHELRTPLAILRANLESLQSGAIQANSETLASLHDEVIRMSKLVKDMETLALAESGNLILQRRRVRFEEVLERLMPVRLEIEARNLSLETAFGDDLPELEMDVDRIVQVMLNLISNAITYSPSGGKIIISGERKEKNIQISVRDQGQGIKEEQLPYVFERFYRADDSRSRRSGGMGLGLAIAKSYVEAHGGNMWVKSSPGQGSSFCFTLPVE